MTARLMTAGELFGVPESAAERIERELKTLYAERRSIENRIAVLREQQHAHNDSEGIDDDRRDADGMLHAGDDDGAAA